MIDLHCHILPGVDDGARTLAEAVAMCRAAAADGCTAMVATPHQRKGEWWNADRGRLAELAGALQAAVDPSPDPGFAVLLGGEIHVDPQLLAEVERLPDGGGILPLAGTRSLLIEFGAAGASGVSGIGGFASDLVHELVVAGWQPVVAHPEFIPWLAADPSLVARLVALGATTQVTAMSVTGDFGRKPQSDALALIEAGLVHFVASDSHDLRRRPPGLSRAYQAVSGRWGRDLAERLFVDNPRAVVESRPLPRTAPARA